MYDEWCIENKISSDGSSRKEKGSRIGRDIDIKPEQAISHLSIPLGLSKEEILADPKNTNAKRELPSELILTTIHTATARAKISTFCKITANLQNTTVWYFLINYCGKTFKSPCYFSHKKTNVNRILQIYFVGIQKMFWSEGIF